MTQQKIVALDKNICIETAKSHKYITKGNFLFSQYTPFAYKL